MSADLRKLADYVTDLLESTVGDGCIPEPFEELYLARGEDEFALTPQQCKAVNDRRHDAYATAEERLALALGYHRCECGRYIADGWPRCAPCQKAHYLDGGLPNTDDDYGVPA